MNSQQKILLTVQDVAVLISVISQASDLLEKIRAANSDAWADVAADVQDAVAGWRNISDDVAAIVGAGVTTTDTDSTGLHPDALGDQVTQFVDAVETAPVATTYADASIDDVVGTNTAVHGEPAPADSLHSGPSGILPGS